MRAHAKGKIEAKQWADDEHEVYGWNLVQNGYLLPLSSMEEGPEDDSEANARRLAACWNACEGLYTESLERSEPLADQIVKIVNSAYVAEKQRDELLETLKEVGLFLHHAWCDIQMNDYSFEKLNKTIATVDKSLAKATGETP
jgi:hypothetical protein